MLVSVIESTREIGTAGLTSLLDWIHDEPLSRTFGGTTVSHEKYVREIFQVLELVKRAGVTQW